MNNAAPNPETIPPVIVRRHRVDWEANDLAELTSRRALSRHQRLRTGCWYLNPRFTVSCPAPTAEFFRTVSHIRSSWLRTCRQVQGKPGHRYQVRQAEREARRGTLLMTDPEVTENPSVHLLSKTTSIRDLPAYHRREVIKAGQVAKQLSFSGILLIDGELIPPRTWQTLAGEGQEPNSRT
jgi:hypothetical protein